MYVLRIRKYKKMGSTCAVRGAVFCSSGVFTGGGGCAAATELARPRPRPTSCCCCELGGRCGSPGRRASAAAVPRDLPLPRPRARPVISSETAYGDISHDELLLNRRYPPLHATRHRSNHAELHTYPGFARSQ